MNLPNLSPEMMAAMQEQVAKMTPAQIEAMMAATRGVDLGAAQAAAAAHLAGATPDDIRRAGEAMAAATPEAMSAGMAAASARLKYEVDASARLKAEGNAAFAKSDWAGAAAAWGRAAANLAAHTSADAVTLRRACRLNLALAHLKLRDWASAESEASAVLQEEPGNVKALVRRGSARLEAGGNGDKSSVKRAVADLKAALAGAAPGDREAVSAKLAEAEAKLAAAGSAGKEEEDGGIAPPSSSSDDEEVVVAAPAPPPAAAAAPAFPGVPAPGGLGASSSSQAAQMRAFAAALRADPGLKSKMVAAAAGMSPSDLAAAARAAGGPAPPPEALTPAAMSAAATAMAGMTPEQLEAMADALEGSGGGGSGSAPPGAPPTASSGPPLAAPPDFSHLMRDPAMVKQAAAMLKGMDPAALAAMSGGAVSVEAAEKMKAKLGGMSDESLAKMIAAAGKVQAVAAKVQAVKARHMHAPARSHRVPPPPASTSTSTAAHPRLPSPLLLTSLARRWAVTAAAFSAARPPLSASPAVAPPLRRAFASSASATPTASASSTGYMAEDLGSNDLERLATGGPRVPSIRSELRAAFSTAIATAFPDLAAAAPANAALEATREAKHGDYQCNAAMGLFGRGKGTPGFPAKSPRDVATAIVGALPPSPLLAGPPDLAGPGFINVKIDRAALAARVKKMLVEGPSTWAPTLPATRAVVDFSSPNVAKEMHVGHLRSTIIGDTIARTLEFCGVDTLRLNHVGDWGTQFGMLIQHMAETHTGGLDAVGDADVGDLQALYKAAKKRFDAEEDFKSRAREAVTRLQGGDPAATAAWKTICAASRKEFEAIYDRLGVQLTERGESYYNPLLPGLVADMEKAGVAVEDGGAKVVWVEGQEHPLIIQKSDGGFGYATTDLAALRQRVSDEKADWVIYVTDAGQATHFKMVFDAAGRAGFIPKKGDDDKKEAASAATASASSPRIDHVGFGLVLGSDGKRIRTRDEGAAVRLVELLDEAVARAAAAIRERDPGAEPERVDAAAKAMGFAAVKYADLKNNRSTNYKFNFDDMLALQGDTAVYLLYAHARIAAIARKAGKDVGALARDAAVPIDLATDAEAALALHLARFPEAIEDMAADLAPNRLTEYLYGLTEAFNAFYTECKVVGDPAEGSRLQLAEGTAVVMRAVMGLLGITPLYRI